jgi:hypothetical protein
MSAWFEVDRRGLADLQKRRGKASVVVELISNALDENVKVVTVSLSEAKGSRGLADLLVKDDSPEGFRELVHAYTLFAPSYKKGDPEKRGRFNLGEKLVLALCTWARIQTTTGTVEFGAEGRIKSRARRLRGTTFEATIALNAQEIKEALTLMHQLIIPRKVQLWINGERAAQRAVLKSFVASLQTEVAGDDGEIRRTRRKAKVDLLHPKGELALLYELGVPVVATGDTFDVNVHQKVPLNFERDNVTPSFLRDLRTHVLNHASDLLSTEEATQTWVKEAMKSEDVEPEAVQAVIEKRFGEKVVSFDLNDPEANKLAVSKGYTVLHGATLSKEEWSNVRKSEIVKPAGQVTPSPKALFSAFGEESIERSEWSDGMKRVALYSQMQGEFLLGIGVEVLIYRRLRGENESFSASYHGGVLSFSLQGLGRHFFDEPNEQRIDALLIHEFAHHRESDHLSERYHDALCELGAKLKHSPTSLRHI